MVDKIVDWKNGSNTQQLVRVYQNDFVDQRKMGQNIFEIELELKCQKNGKYRIEPIPPKT